MGVGQVSMREFSLPESQVSFFNLEKVKHMWQKLSEVLLLCHRTLLSLIVTTFLATFATSCGL